MDSFVFRNIRTVSAVFFHNVIDVMEQVSEEGIKQVETPIESSYKTRMNKLNKGNIILLPHKKWKNKYLHIHRISMYNLNKNFRGHLFKVQQLVQLFLTFS
jgi:hypothetical protein